MTPPTSGSELSQLFGKFKRGLPKDPTDEDLETYVDYRITIYKQKGWTRSRLSNFYAEDFTDFTADIFSKLTPDTRRTLRDYLLDNGVFVPSGRSTRIATALRAAVEEELPWPSDPTQTKTTATAPTPQGGETSGTTDGNIVGAASAAPAGMAGTGERWATGRIMVDTDNDGGQRMSGRVQTRSESPNIGGAERNKGIANVLKIYSSAPTGDKYSGTLTDIFELKLAIFEERCDQNGVPSNARGICFSSMLTGAALNYYFTTIKGKTLDYSSMTDMLRRRYMTPERELSLTREWNKINLKDYITRHSGRTPVEALELMVERLNALRMTLPRPFQDDAMFRNRLLDACDGIPECRLARQKVSGTVQGVIADLQTSISTYQPILPQPSPAAAYMVDRKRRPPTL